LESSRPWESRGSAAGAPPQVSSVATPPAPAAQQLGEGLRRPCRGQTCGGMLGAMARIVAAGARPRNFQPLLRRLCLRHKNSARASGGLAGGRRVGACLGRWRALSPALPVYRRRTIFEPQPFLSCVARDLLELSRIFYTAISFYRRELLRIENYRKPTRMSRSHSRSVKGPPCGAGLAPWYSGASQATAPQGGQYQFQ
jgi:hypothetical protein